MLFTEDNANKKRKCCPLCGSQNIYNRKLFERDFSEAGDMSPFRRYQVYCCSKCGMLYAGDLEETMPLNDYYRKMSKYDDNPESWDGDDYSLRVQEFIADSGLQKTSKIIDVGCGAGYVLRQLKKAGYTNLYGLELSEANCRYLQNSQGICTFNGGIGDWSSGVAKHSFDVVVLKGVLEHLMSLYDDVLFCAELLAEGGRLLLACPDVTNFPRFRDCYQQLSSEHINYFDTNSIVYLCAALDLELIEFREVGLFRPATYSECSMWMFGKGTGKTLKYGNVAGEDSMVLYLSQCGNQLKQIRERYSSYYLADGFYLWGAGTLAATLFQFGILNKNLIRAVFDSNTNYHGHLAYGHPVQSPQDLQKMKRFPILIASQTAFAPIMGQITAMGLNNPIIDLFS